MTIDRPGIGGADAGEPGSVVRRNGSPEAEGAVNVHPRASLTRPSADFSGGVECSGIHVACLNTNQSVIVEGRKRIGTDASLAIHRNPSQARAAEPEQRECLQ